MDFLEPGFRVFHGFEVHIHIEGFRLLALCDGIWERTHQAIGHSAQDTEVGQHEGSV